MHNPHAFEQLGPSSTTIFNIALAEKDSKLDKPVVLRKDTQGSMFRLQCDQHEFMQSFFMPVTNPYYVVVKDDGSFEIKDVPAGKHKIMAWHPFAGRVEIEADVPEGGRVETKLEIKKKMRLHPITGRVPGDCTGRNYQSRFALWALTQDGRDRRAQYHLVKSSSSGYSH